MYAVIRSGGKQYKVSKDDVISVEKLIGETGDKINLNEVLMIGGEAIQLLAIQSSKVLLLMLK